MPLQRCDDDVREALDDVSSYEGRWPATGAADACSSLSCRVALVARPPGREVKQADAFIEGKLSVSVGIVC